MKKYSLSTLVKLSTYKLLVAILFITPSLSYASDRVALLIANEDYVRGDLANPINDAKLIEQKLSSLGFDVTVVENANRYQMLSAIEKFGADSQGADSAVFYYSGHGMQDDYKQNFLLPTDANITGESSIRAYGVEAYEVINALKKAKPRISLVMFDACRDNPFAGVRGNRNFAVESYQTDSELLVSYATQTGQYAQDGVAGRNSPYAIALANQLEQATSTPLLKMFDNVKDEVKRQTNNQQSPIIRGDMGYSEKLITNNTTAYQAELALSISGYPDKETIASNDVEAIDNLVDIMKQDPQSVIELVSHTYNSGQEYENIILTRKRASKLKNTLVTQYGIADERVSILGAGATRPIDSNATEEGRQHNNRIDVTIRFH